MKKSKSKYKKLLSYEDGGDPRKLVSTDTITNPLILSQYSRDGITPQYIVHNKYQSNSNNTTLKGSLSTNNINSIPKSKVQSSEVKPSIQSSSTLRSSTNHEYIPFYNDQMKPLGNKDPNQTNISPRQVPMANKQNLGKGYNPVKFDGFGREGLLETDPSTKEQFIWDDRLDKLSPSKFIQHCMGGYIKSNGGQIPKYSLGSWLKNSLMPLAETGAGIGLLATGAGAAAGIPLLASGVGGLAKNTTDTIQQDQLKKKQPQDLAPSVINNNPFGNQYKNGGGLSRSKDYGSASHPYPSVSSSDFAGRGRSYPIPTKADAVDALKLAYLHGRSDIIAKVHNKYPSLKANGGMLNYEDGGVRKIATSKGIIFLDDNKKQAYDYKGNSLNYNDFTTPQMKAHQMYPTNSLHSQSGDSTFYMKGYNMTDDQYDQFNPGLSSTMYPVLFGKMQAEEDANKPKQYKSGGKHWIQGAINKSHKGWCTPLSKSTCTGHRRALALRFKHGLEDGGDLIQYNGAKHEQGGIDVNSNGIPVNDNTVNANVEGGETSLDNYIFSNTLGLNKNKEVELNPKQVHKTFADLSKTANKKFGGRTDIVSQNTKQLAYSDIKNKNEKAINMKNEIATNKFNKSVQRFHKKWGGMIYADGGVPNPDKIIYPGDNVDFNLSQNQLLNRFEGFDKPLLGSNPSTDMNFEDLPQPERSSGITNTNYSVPGTNKFSSSPSSGISGIGDYIAPAFDVLAAGVSLFNKGKNYKQVTDRSSLDTLNRLPETSDYSGLYEKNNENFNTSNKFANLYSPSISNSLRSNNLSQVLKNNNDIAFQKSQEDNQRLTNKLGAIAQEKDRLSGITNDYNHTYNVEGNQDRSQRETNTLGYLSGAATSLGQIRTDQELAKVIPAALTYYKFNTKTSKYELKDPSIQFSLGLPLTVEKTK